MIPSYEGNSEQDAVWLSLKRHEMDQQRQNPPKLPWIMSQEERETNTKIFHACNPTGGTIGIAKAMDVFRRSKIDNQELTKIMALIQANLRGKLNVVEFQVVMSLIYRRLHGNIVPDNVPLQLVPPINKDMGTYAVFQKYYAERRHSKYFPSSGSLPDPPCWLELRMAPLHDVLHFGNDGCRVVRLTQGIVLKYGGYKSNFLEELLCLQHVRHVTTIPVPRPLHHPLRRNLWYLCTEEAPGVNLESCINTMTTDQLDHIVLQLKSYLDQMRKAHPQKTLGSVTGGPYSNAMFPIPPKHAFSSVRDFNHYWHDTLLLFCSTEFADKLMSQLPLNCAVNFTHADLVPRNIMVQGSTITAILDWAFAGWYPEYWEYCRMRSWESLNWEYVVHSIFQPREREWVAFKTLTSNVWDTCG